ncbi:hypothetical protein FB451DRAFT_1479239 [Mycena latifolia]|nr:hypothetical protein FB451DRAFT_1479239 [Mycena latifolia]
MTDFSTDKSNKDAVLFCDRTASDAGRRRAVRALVERVAIQCSRVPNLSRAPSRAWRQRCTRRHRRLRCAESAVRGLRGHRLRWSPTAPCMALSATNMGRALGFKSEFPEIPDEQLGNLTVQYGLLVVFVVGIDINSYLLRYFGDLSIDAYEKGAAFMANRQWERAFQVSPEELQRRIVRGKYGLDLVCPYLEFFSPQKGIKGTEAVGMLARRIHQLKELLNAGAKHSDGMLLGGKPKPTKSMRVSVSLYAELSATMIAETNVEKPGANEELVVELFANKLLAADRSVNSEPCCPIAHPHNGRKLKFAGGHPRTINGQTVSQCPIVHHKCPIQVALYVPVHGPRHPHFPPEMCSAIPPILNVSHQSAWKRPKCARAVGFVGSTVAKVDNSIVVINDKHKRRDPVRQEKKKECPATLGVAGVYPRDREDLESESSTPSPSTHVGRRLDYFYLLHRDGAEVFDEDTTFQQIEGDLKEWEVVIFDSAIYLIRQHGPNLSAQIACHPALIPPPNFVSRLDTGSSLASSASAIRRGIELSSMTHTPLAMGLDHGDLSRLGTTWTNRRLAAGRPVEVASSSPP